MSRSPQNASSTHASHNNCFIRRVHNSENRRAPYRTARKSIHRRPRRNNNVGEISIRFTGNTHIHTGDTAFGMMDAARPQYLRTRGYPSQISNVVPTPFADTGVRISEHSSPGNNSQPPPSFRYVPSTRVNEFAGVPIPAAGRGSSVAGYHQQTHIGGHTYVPGPNICPAPFLHTDVAGPEYPRDWRYPQPSGGLYNGAQMDAVRRGSVTDGYNAGGPGACLTPGVQTPAGSSGVGYNQLTPNATLAFAGQTSQAPFLPEYDTRATAPPAVGLGLNNGGFTSGAQMNAVRPGSVTGVQTPAVGLGPAGSSGVGYNQLSPIATSGFAGQTSQAPTVPEYDTQAAAPPPTLDQQLFPANNAFAEDFLLPALFDNFMDMLEPRF